VQGQYDLSRAVVEIGDSFVDEGAYDPFLEPRVRRRGRPDRLEVLGERVERDGRKGGTEYFAHSALRFGPFRHV
jgi:hypothetical protein